MIDLPLFFGTTASVASFYLASQREIALMRAPGERKRSLWSAVRRLPLVMSIGIGLCVNQTRAVLEALMGRETEFVRTPKHGIRGKLESWSGKKYRSAKSLTPFIELAMAAYFVVAIVVAIDHRPLHLHPVPLPVPLRLRLRRLGDRSGRAASAWRCAALGRFSSPSAPASRTISPAGPMAT